MYRSCLLIDTGDNPDRHRPGRLWLRNRYHVHQRLCMAFPSATRRSGDEHFLQPFKAADFALGHVHVRRAVDAGFLYRVMPVSHSRAVIIVQSAAKPDWEYAFHNAQYLLAAAPEVKEIDPQFSAGQWLRFSLVANPTRKIDTKSAPDGSRRNGQRVPVRPEQLLEWLAGKAHAAGFALQAESTTFQLGYIYMNKDGRGQRLRSVVFDGLLRVTDPLAFRRALIAGIGSGKAFGFGLLSVVPADDPAHCSAR